MVFGDGLINGDIYIYPRLTPHCHGNEIWDKIGYHLACVRDFCEIFAPKGVFRGWANAANPIFPQPTPVAMSTKFGTKLAITLLA